MAAEVVDQRIDYVGERVVPFGSMIDQQWVNVRILVEETRRSTSGPLLLEERKVATEERDALVWGRDPSLFHFLVSNMVDSIPSILPENRPRVADQVSTYINTTFLQPRHFFFSAAGLQFTYRIHLHTTHRFDEFDFLEDGFLDVGDHFFRLVHMPIEQEEEGEEEEPPTRIETLPTKSYTAAIADDDGGGCCAVCLEDLVEGATVSELPCSHIFHTDCILPWLKRKPSCPTCRSQISSP